MATPQIQPKANGKTRQRGTQIPSLFCPNPFDHQTQTPPSPPFLHGPMATDGDGHPRGGATTAAAAADLFVCFTSRTSSSLMKVPSKSLFSPVRPGVDAGHGPAAASSTSSSSTMLYTSLSRRLRHSGSLRSGGQASPMFPPAGSGKKKAALEEPSSPKVTCIGQVRVKTMKQGKKMRPAAASRSRSRRRSEGGSFREREQQRYWAALPISICEAVRALGAEFNCFQPCGSAQSWCASSASPAAEREKADRKRPARSYCGAVFARWLVALNEEEGKEVVSHVPEKEEMVKVEEGRLERLGDAAVVVEEEEGGYQVCVPPKNALLLMRCRSEPFRMASYTNRFWESPANPEIGRGEGEAEEEEVEEEENGNATGCEVKAEIEEEEEEEVVEEEKRTEDVADVEAKEEDKVAIFVADETENTGRSSVCVEEEDKEGMKLNEQKEKVELGEGEQASDHESPLSDVPKDDDVATDGKIQEETPSKTEPSSESDEREEQKAIEEEEKSTQLPQTHTLEEEEKDDDEEEEREDAQPEQIELPEKTESIKEEDDEKVEVKAIAIVESEEAMGAGEEVDMAAEEVPSPPPPPPATAEEKAKEEEDGALPECLLLMLYEPKLSMEVSKETWVCSTDFFQWRPGKNSRPKLAGDTAVAGGGVIEGRRNSTDSRPSRPSSNRVAAVSAATAAAATARRPLATPPPSMATVVEEKLVKAAAYEPLVLTRCKSEPMRTSARLAPEACFWKSGRKIPQPPRRSLRADPVS